MNRNIDTTQRLPMLSEHEQKELDFVCVMQGIRNIFADYELPDDLKHEMSVVRNLMYSHLLREGSTIEHLDRFRMF